MIIDAGPVVSLNDDDGPTTENVGFNQAFAGKRRSFRQPTLKPNALQYQ
jgi:hypothetical protein